MRLTIAAVGRLRGGPEADLVADYLARATKAGRAFGLGPAGLFEIDERKAADRAAEADALRRAVPDGAVLVTMDERGRTLSSRQFADRIAGWRDAGQREAAFLIGGADGLDPGLRKEADLVLSFGPMVWPHRLARAMLAEQLYRGVSILGGLPYHRD